MLGKLEEITAAAAAGTMIQAWSIVWSSLFPSCFLAGKGSMTGHNRCSSVSIAAACQSGFTFVHFVHFVHFKLQPLHALFAAPC